MLTFARNIRYFLHRSTYLKWSIGALWEDFFVAPSNDIQIQKSEKQIIAIKWNRSHIANIFYFLCSNLHQRRQHILLRLRYWTWTVPKQTSCAKDCLDSDWDLTAPFPKSTWSIQLEYFHGPISTINWTAWPIVPPFVHYHCAVSKRGRNISWKIYFYTCND